MAAKPSRMFPVDDSSRLTNALPRVYGSIASCDREPLPGKQRLGVGALKIHDLGRRHQLEKVRMAAHVGDHQLRHQTMRCEW